MRRVGTTSYPREVGVYRKTDDAGVCVNPSSVDNLRQRCSRIGPSLNPSPQVSDWCVAHAVMHEWESPKGATLCLAQGAATRAPRMLRSPGFGQTSSSVEE